MASGTLAGSSGSNDIPVTLEDQQKINRFARLNAAIDEYKDELKIKSTDLQNIEDALNEISIVQLEDDAGTIKVMEGEVFVTFPCEEAETWILTKKEKLNSEVTGINEKIEAIKQEMIELKAALYGKFGKNNINLESDE